MKANLSSRYILSIIFSFFAFLGVPCLATAQVLLGEEANPPKYETRAVWLTTLGGLDWPKAKARTLEGREQQKQELCQILDQLQAIHINTVLLQTRVRGSVIYPSKIEPWDVALTGEYNANPGYDPLQFAIDECHKRGMELHAWVVTIPAYKIAVAKQMGASGLHVKKPQLVKKHREQYYLDPGLPETGAYLESLCSEIVKNYDVDGIHFDYIRYPEGASSFPDGKTYKLYSAGQPKAKWRRDNVTRIVRRIYNSVKAVKPWVKVTSSPVGKSHDLSRFSSRGWNCYDAVHQDAQGWMAEGIHDGLFPMMYFKGDHFFPFAADWREQDHGRPVAPGLGIYFMHPSEKNWPLSDITNQLHFIRQQGLGGQAYFRSRFLTDNVKGLYDYLKQTFYAFPALVPPATWLDSIAPGIPEKFAEEVLEDGRIRLSWSSVTDNVSQGGVFYNVYGSSSWPVDITKAENLLAVRLSSPFYIYNKQWAQLNGLHVVVTSMDRFGNESLAAGIEGMNVAPRLPWEQPHAEILRPDTKGGLALPERDAPFCVVTDLCGHIVQTGPYASMINVKRLKPGWYRVSTLQKKGVTHRVLEFWR